MRLLISTCLLAALLPAADLAPQAGDWIRLDVAKTGLLRGKKHVFLFPAYKGTVDAAAPSFEISLDSAKIVVEDEWLKPADRAKVLDFTLKDMLDASRHPLILYRSSRVVRTGNEANAEGVLRIRGIERPVQVKLKDLGNNVYEGSSSVDMRLFNLKPPSAALGTIGTEPVMQLRFRLTLR